MKIFNCGGFMGIFNYGGFMKKEFYLILLGLVVFTFASCKNSKGQKNDVSSKITIDIWSWEAGEMQAVADIVQPDFPNVEFRISAFPFNEYQTKILNALRSKSGPDLYYMGDERMTQFFENGLAVDMKEYGFDPEKELRGHYYDFAIDLGSYQNKFLTVGWKVAPTILFYNSPKALEYFGTNDPEKIGKMSKTWEGFYQLSKIVSEKSGRKDITVDDYNVFTRAYLRSAGQALITEDGTINVSVIRQAYSYLKSLIDLGVVSEENGASAVGKLYGQGRLFSAPAAPWALKYILEAGAPNSAGEWRSTYLAPAFQGYWGFLVNTFSKNKQTAVDVVKDFVTRPELSVQLLSPTNDFPADIRVLEMMKDNQFDFLGGQNPITLWKESAESIQIGPSFEKNSNLAMKFVANPVQSMILDNSISVDEAIELFIQDALTQIPSAHK